MANKMDAMLMDDILLVPATYVNGIYVTPYQSKNCLNVRLTFYETHPAAERIKCAVMMSIDDLVAIQTAITAAITALVKEEMEQKDAVLQ